MGNARIELRIERRLKEDFEKCVPNASAFIRMCIIEKTYGADSAQWPDYIYIQERGRPRPTISSMTEETPLVKGAEIPKNLGEIVFGKHMKMDTVSMLDNPPEGVISENIAEGVDKEDDEVSLTLDQMIEAIKMEGKQ